MNVTKPAKNYRDSNNINATFLKPRAIIGSLCGFVVTSKQELAKYLGKITPNNNNPKILAQNIGSRATTIIANKDGSYDLFCNKPQASTLVLSGGGAKGCAHNGAYQALEYSDTLQFIKKVSGTSAGAVTASLISTGMTASEINKTMDDMKPHAMANSNDTIEDELSPHWNNTTSNSIQLNTTKKHLIDEKGLPKTILEKIKFYISMFISLFIGKERRACKLEKFLSDVTSNYFLEKIRELNEQQQQELAKLIEKLQYQRDNPLIAGKQNARLTFADLETLSDYLPDMKQLDVNATLIVDGKAQTLVYNSQHTPDMDIYTAVRISASLPGLFPKYKKFLLLDTSNQHDKSTEKLKVIQTDGGCTAHIPTTGSQNRKELLCNNHYIDDNKDNIIIVFGNDLINSAHTQRPTYNLGNAFVDFIASADVTNSHWEECEIMRDFYLDQTVMTRLAVVNNGSIVTNHTTNVLLSATDMHVFQNSACEQVKSHIKKSANELLGNHYTTLKQALFAMKDEHLTDFLNGLDLDNNENNTIIANIHEVIAMRQQAHVVMDTIKQAINSYSDDDDDNTTASKKEKLAQLTNLLASLDNEYSEQEEFKTCFAFEMYNSKDTQFTRYINLTEDISKNVDSAFLLALYKEGQKRSHKYNVYNIIKSEIDPLIFRVGQSKENITLLENVKTSLLCTENKDEIDHMMRLLDELYESTRIDKIKKIIW